MVDVAPEVVDKGFVLRSLRHFIDGLELDFARYAAEFHQSNQWEAEGYNSAADWMRFNCHMNSYAVWNALAAGEQEAKLAQSIESMKAGEIGFAHLATLGRTADEMGNGFDEIKLLPLAKKHSPGKFHQKVLHFKHSVDAAGYNRDRERLAEERRLRMSTAQDGCLLLYGVLDPVAGRRCGPRSSLWLSRLVHTTTGIGSSATPTPWSSWPRAVSRPTSRSRPPSRP